MPVIPDFFSGFDISWSLPAMSLWEEEWQHTVGVFN